MKIFERDYTVNTSQVNVNKKLGLYGLLGILQDAASLHADHLGFGYEEMIKRNTFWVLTRQRVEMKKWPNWNETITLKTWSRPLDGMMAYRDYEIFRDGKFIGSCSTSWMVMNGESRRPVKLHEIDSPIDVREDYKLDYEATKVLIPEDGEKRATFQVRISDLDMNHHVNNTKYAQWVLDSVPFQLHKLFLLKTFEINFLAETFLDDDITIYRSEIDNGAIYYGKREKDQKVVFSSLLKS